MRDSFFVWFESLVWISDWLKFWSSFDFKARLYLAIIQPNKKFWTFGYFWGIRKVGLISFCLLLYVSSHCSYVPLRRQDLHSELPFEGLDLLIEELSGHIPSLVVLAIRWVNNVFDFKDWTRLLLSLRSDIYCNIVISSLDVICTVLLWCKSRHIFSFRYKVFSSLYADWMFQKSFKNTTDRCGAKSNMSIQQW